MAQRDVGKRPDRAQLRRVLGVGDDAEEIIPLDDQASFEQQALITLLEAVAEVRGRMTQLEESQRDVLAALAGLDEVLRRERRAPDVVADVLPGLEAVSEALAALPERVVESLQGQFDMPASASDDVPANGSGVRRFAVVPTLREVLSVARELQSRPDVSPDVRRLVARLDDAGEDRSIDDQSA